MSPEAETSLWQSSLARAWYIWGLSWCYWGIQSGERWCFRKGVRAFTKAIQLAPYDALPLYRRGLIRGRELGEHQAAINDLSQAIALDPEWAEPFLQRGFFQRFHGDQQAAAADLRQFIQMAPHSHWRSEAELQLAALEAE